MQSRKASTKKKLAPFRPKSQFISEGFMSGGMEFLVFLGRGREVRQSLLLSRTLYTRLGDISRGPRQFVLVPGRRLQRAYSNDFVTTSPFVGSGNYRFGYNSELIRTQSCEPSPVVISTLCILFSTPFCRLSFCVLRFGFLFFFLFSFHSTSLPHVT